MKFNVLNDLSPDQCMLALASHEEARKKSSSEGRVINVGFLNWAAPSTIIAANQQKQAALIGGLMAMVGARRTPTMRSAWPSCRSSPTAGPPCGSMRRMP
eukprot:7875491-Alexandrium_andersonii.AAC.1